MSDDVDTSYARLGSITRELHEALSKLGYDQMLQQTAAEIPDARERLSYVATMTQAAADKVLGAVERGSPECDAVARQGDDLAAALLRMAETLREGDIGKARVLMRQCAAYASRASDFSRTQKALLMDIMMSQDFQDLSGQIIKRVVDIITRTEKQLLELLVHEAPELLQGQQDFLSGADLPDRAMKQDDVDNLLESLGF